MIMENNSTLYMYINIAPYFIILDSVPVHKVGLIGFDYYQIHLNFNGLSSLFNLQFHDQNRTTLNRLFMS